MYRRLKVAFTAWLFAGWIANEAVWFDNHKDHFLYDGGTVSELKGIARAIDCHAAMFEADLSKALLSYILWPRVVWSYVILKRREAIVAEISEGLNSCMSYLYANYPNALHVTGPGHVHMNVDGLPNWMVLPVIKAVRNGNNTELCALTGDGMAHTFSGMVPGLHREDWATEYRQLQELDADRASEFLKEHAFKSGNFQEDANA